MKTRIVTPPAVEPITLTEAKLHLRLAVDEASAVLYTAEDAKLTAIIQAARERVETITWRALITQTWDAVFDGFPSGDLLKLPYPDLQSVTSVSYVDGAGVTSTFTDFTADLFSNGVRLNHGCDWPAIQDGSRVTVRFVAGYGDAATDVPASIKQAMLLIVGNYHENTEETVAASFGREVALLPMGVDALLSGFRRYEF